MWVRRIALKDLGPLAAPRLAVVGSRGVVAWQPVPSDLPHRGVGRPANEMWGIAVGGWRAPWWTGATRPCPAQRLFTVCSAAYP